MSDALPFYRGHEEFEEVLADQKLSRPGRAIRVYNYGGHSRDEKLYAIGTGGKLFDAESGEEVEAKDVFSKEAAPDGWSVEGFELALLPESELMKILKDEKLARL